MRRLAAAVLVLALVLDLARPAAAALHRSGPRPAGKVTPAPALSPLPASAVTARLEVSGKAVAQAPAPLPAGLAADPAAAALAEAARALSAERGGEQETLDRLFQGDPEPKKRGFGQVFQDPERNNTFWKWTAGQAALSFGLSAYGTALPRTVDPGEQQASQLAALQAAGVLARGGASMSTGAYIDARPPASTMNRMNMMAAGALLLAPVILISGFWTYAALVSIVAAFSAFQTVSMNAGAVAWNRIVGRTESLNFANAVGTVVLSVASIAGALSGGVIVEWIGPRAAEAMSRLKITPDVAGGALTFGLYGLIIASVAAAFAYYLRLPNDAAPAAAARRRMFRELIEGFRLVFTHPTLRLFAVVLAVTATVGTVVLTTVLPVFVASLPAVPLAYAWTMASGAAATGVASLLVAWNDRRHPSSDQHVLERQARRSALLRAASWAIFSSTFLSGSAYAVFVVGFLVALTQVPATIIWGSVQSRLVMRDFPNDQGKVYSAIAFLTLASTFLGLLTIGPVLAFLGVPLIPAAVAALGVAVLADLALYRYAFPRR